MAVRMILVPLSGRFDPDSPQSLDWSSLETGLKVGQQLAAHVEVLCVTGAPSDPEKALSAWIPDYGVERLIGMIEEEGRTRHQHARSAFETVIDGLEQRPAVTSEATPGFSVDFVELSGEIRNAVGSRGRLADLVVTANSPERWHWSYRPILDAALRDTGRPLLVVPPTAQPSLGQRVAVAWNGSIEAARALAAMLDFVEPGADVVVLSVSEGSSPAPGIEEVAAYLRWHGLESRTLELPGDARSSGEVIVRRALALNCDLLVLGACIHSRAHRMVFGSMTESVLSSAQIAALMAT